MTETRWTIKGREFVHCNCAYGCPCDFNARPTLGYCKGLVAMHIKKGHFDDIHLDGLKFAAVVEWPGALHEGNGAMQPIIEERASPAQREALFKIFSGKHSADGTLFHILSLIVSRIHDPIFAPIEFSFDMEERTARIRIPGVLESDVEPIKNPVTGAPHRIEVMMPEGFEHRQAEIASATIRSSGAIKFETKASHSSLATVVQTPQGVAG